MASIEELITPDKLRSNMFSQAFNNRPHKYFVVYDNLMDELIVKIVRPDTLAAEFPITDNYSLLVEPQTFEVVGIQLSNFTEEHLPNMELAKFWFKRDLANYFSEYKEISYQPTQSSRASNDSYFFVRADRISSILVAA